MAAAAPVDLEHEADDNLHWRCGSGDRDALGNGCDVWLPRRGLCPRHRAAVMAAGVAARIDTPAIRRWAAEHSDAGAPPPDVERRNGIVRRVPAEPVEGYRERTSREAAERREALARRIAEYIRERGGPLLRRDIAAPLGVDAANRAFSEALALAVERGDVLHVKTGPKGLCGLYSDQAAVDRARDAAAALAAAA